MYLQVAKILLNVLCTVYYRYVKVIAFIISDLFYPWYQYELEWEQFSRDNPDYPILNLYYEDLKQVYSHLNQHKMIHLAFSSVTR